MLAGGLGKVIFHEKISAKSVNVMVSPKNLTVGPPVTSADQAGLQIFGHGNVFKTACLYQSDLFHGRKSGARPDQRLLSTQQGTIFDFLSHQAHQVAKEK